MITQYDYNEQPKYSAAHEGDYESDTSLVKTERFAQIRRQLFGVACVYEAEQCMSALLYGAHGMSIYRPGLELLSKLADQVDNKKLWAAVKRLFDTMPVLNGYTSYADIVGTLLQDLEATEELLSEWATMSYTTATLALNSAGSALNQYAYDPSTGKHTTLQDDDFVPPLDARGLRKAVVRSISDQLQLKGEVHSIDAANLQELELPDIVATPLSSKEALVADITSNLNLVTFEERISIVSSDIHIVRYDYTGELGNEEPKLLGYCFLSLYYERLGWITREVGHDIDVAKLKRRIGGRIGAARSPMKNLETLAAG